MSDVRALVWRRQRAVFGVLLCLTSLLTSFGLLAEEARDEARQHFNHALELVDNKRYEEAAAEFERAYELSPNPAVLYNLGRAHAAARHPAQAVAAFRGYVAGVADVEDSRRKQALRELPRLEALLGVLALSTQPSGADVRVDGRAVQAGPLQLDPGRHVIVVSAPGYAVAEREVVLASGSRQQLEIELSAAKVTRTALVLPAAGSGIPPAPTSSMQASPVPPRSRSLPGPRRAGTRPAPAESKLQNTRQGRIWWAVSAAGAGLVLGGVTAGLAIDSGARYRSWREEQTLLDQRWSSAPADAELTQRQGRNDARADRIKLEDQVTVGVGVASAACFVGAVMVWLLSDSPAEPRAQLGWSPDAHAAALSTTW